jgi:hypothetical protein
MTSRRGDDLGRRRVYRAAGSSVRRQASAVTMTATASTAAPRRRTALFLAFLAAVCGTGYVLTGMPATAALLTDAVTTAQISVTAGTLNPPTGLALSDTGSAVRVAWVPPAAGIAPQDYEIFARPSAGSYAGTPTASDAVSPWDDPSPTECSTWFYKVRSSHTNLKSAFTGESSLTVDRTAPTVNAAHVVFTGGSTNVADYVRSSGGAVEVYANVSDNCSASNALTVRFDLSALGAGTVGATVGNWTPIAGGPTYNYRATFTLANGVVADAATKTWSVSATDPNGNARSGVAGTPVTGDGAGPVYGSAEMVSAYTNFYDAALGRGEIPSDGSASTSGSYVYANFTDAGSGVASITANLAAGGILTGGTAVPLASGSYTTYGNATPWDWRSAATVINTGLADGNLTFTVTATDKVGNSPVTSAARTVEIDDTPFSATTASCTNTGNANNALDSGDGTNFVLGDTIYPNSVKTNWTGTLLTGSPVLRNGAADYFDLNTDFGLTVFQGTGYNESWNLGATTWVTTSPTYTNSTLALSSATTLRLAYQGASVTDQASTAQATFGTTLRDAAGNPVAAAFTESCATSPW